MGCNSSAQVQEAPPAKNVDGDGGQEPVPETPTKPPVREAFVDPPPSKYVSASNANDSGPQPVQDCGAAKIEPAAADPSPKLVDTKPKDDAPQPVQEGGALREQPQPVQDSGRQDGAICQDPDSELRATKSDLDLPLDPSLLQPYHELGDYFLRVVLSNKVLMHLQNTIELQHLNVTVKPLNEAASCDTRVCDISAPSRKLVLDALDLASVLEKARAEDIRRYQAQLKEKEKLEQALEEQLQEAAEGDKKETEQAVAVEAEPTPPDVKKPKAMWNCKSQVDYEKGFQGEVPLIFTWTPTPTPFSHVQDPLGRNWQSASSGVRCTNDFHGTVVLEYRRGIRGKWEQIPAERNAQGAYVARLDYKPEKAGVSKLYRGFQSRWIVDDRLYLTPLKRAPSLVKKLSSSDMVAKLLRVLPKEKRTLENLPDPKLRKALLELQNLLPMNTWDINFGLQRTPGVFFRGAHLMSMKEKMEFKAKSLIDPEKESAMRRAMLSSPVQACLAAIGYVGLDISGIIPSIDYFIPKYSEQDVDEVAALEEKVVPLETIRDKLQDELNGQHEEWDGGIRVVLPTSADLKLAASCKRPVIEPSFKVKVVFAHKFNKKDDRKQDHTVSVKYWKASEGRAQSVQIDLEQEEDTYCKTVAMDVGEFHYQWIIDGREFLDEGLPIYSDDDSPEDRAAYLQDSYCKLTVRSGINFGIGVEM